MLDPNPKVVKSCKSSSGHNSALLCLLWAESVTLLTPHLIHPEELMSVKTLVEEVPEISIRCEDFVNQLLAISPIVCAKNVRDGCRDIALVRSHIATVLLFQMLCW